MDTAKLDALPRTFKFTATSLRKAVAAHGDAQNITLRDTELRGLICRKQRRDWVMAIERKIGGKIWRIALEPYSPQTTNLAAVRESVIQIYGEIAAGSYERKMETEKESSALSAMTVAEATELHIETNPQLKESTRYSYRFAAKRLTEGKAKRMADVDGIYIREAYDRICEESAASANLTIRSIGAIWSTWAAEHPEGQEPLRNPTKRLRAKRGRMVKLAPREGVLSPAQRLPWYEAAKATAVALGPSGGAYRALMMLYLTGMRRSEVTGMLWAEVGDEWITIGADRMKGSERLQRPITPAIRSILDAQRQFHGDGGEYVFPARVGDGSRGDVRKALWKVNKAALGDEKAIVCHDLRRGFIATATMAGVPEVATKLLVGHSTNDITRVYARAVRGQLPEIADKIEAALLAVVE